MRVDRARAEELPAPQGGQGHLQRPRGRQAQLIDRSTPEEGRPNRGGPHGPVILLSNNPREGLAIAPPPHM